MKRELLKLQSMLKQLKIPHALPIVSGIGGVSASSNIMVGKTGSSMMVITEEREEQLTLLDMSCASRFDTVPRLGDIYTHLSAEDALRYVIEHTSSSEKCAEGAH